MSPAAEIRRRAGRIAVACLLALSFWELGNGAWIPAKAWLAQEMLEHAWQRASAGAAKPAPWPWADTWPVAKLSAKSGDVRRIVLAGASGRTLAFGPGHSSASALPGERGNTVIAGHRDTHFRFLEDLAIGETIGFEMPDGRRHLYEVTGLDVVDSRRNGLVLDTDDALLSLVTCYPFDAVAAGGPLRYVVTAKIIF